jgi:hypothetical protein
VPSPLILTKPSRVPGQQLVHELACRVRASPLPARLLASVLRWLTPVVLHRIPTKYYRALFLTRSSLQSALVGADGGGWKTRQREDAHALSGHGPLTKSHALEIFLQSMPAFISLCLARILSFELPPFSRVE